MRIIGSSFPRLRNWVVAAALLLPASLCNASTIEHVSLRRLTQIAGIAFAGTVDGMSTTRVSGRVVTLVHFSLLNFAMGQHPGDTLTLRMAGGALGGLIYGPPEQPKFVVGNRYVILPDPDLGSPDNLFLPIIGLYQGFYPIHGDSTHGDSAAAAVVHDWKERPLLAISGGHVVALSSRRPGSGRPGPERPPALDVAGQDVPMELRLPEEDSGTRVSEAAFLGAIRAFAASKR